MFTPRAFHPYKSPKPKPNSSPAGFRIVDYITPRRCFNLFPRPNFLDARSPDPSPLSSPVRGPHGPEDDNSPPTAGVPNPFAGNGFESPLRSFAPSPESRLIGAFPKTDRTRDAPATPPPRRKARHGPKHRSFTHHHHHPDQVLSPHRRARQTEEKRDAVRRRILERHERRVVRARRGLDQLQREAKMLMKPEHVDDEDRIFLAQLEKLVLDRTLTHDLEQCRERMARAEAESPERQRQHAQRDEEAIRAREECQDAEAQEEQKRKVAEFLREKAGRRAARFRLMEEAAMRADEERRRAHEAFERQIREEQERLFYAEQVRKAKEDEERRRRAEEERRLREERERRLREEMERKLREAMERQLREEMERRRREEEVRKLRDESARRCREFHEQFMRAERERQARILAEQARQAAEEEEQMIRHFVVYEGKWNELRTSNELPPIDVREMPWPVFGIVTAADQITHQDVRAFLFHPLRPGVEGKTARDKVKTEMLRFHPDKFNARIVPRIHPSQQTVAQAIAGTVTRILTGIMAEEVEKQA